MIIDANATGSTLVCTRFYTQLPIVYVCSSLKSTTHYHSPSREKNKREREGAHACIYAFQSNLNILTYMEREKQNSCRHFIYVCLCVAIFFWTFFKCINARQRKRNKHNKLVRWKIFFLFLLFNVLAFEILVNSIIIL